MEQWMWKWQIVQSMIHSFLNSFVIYLTTNIFSNTVPGSRNSNMNEIHSSLQGVFSLSGGDIWVNRQLLFCLINAVLKLCLEYFGSPEKHLIQTEELGHGSWRDWHLLWILNNEDISLGIQGSKGILDWGNLLDEVLEACVKEHGR